MDTSETPGMVRIREFAAELDLLTLDQLRADQDGDFAALNEMLDRRDRIADAAPDRVWNALQTTIELVSGHIYLRQAWIDRLTRDESGAAV
jgi:hypothetical protein